MKLKELHSSTFPILRTKQHLSRKIIINCKRAFPGATTWNLTKEITKINCSLTNVIQNIRACLLLESSVSESYTCKTKG
jgi:hypothetical protein